MMMCSSGSAFVELYGGTGIEEVSDSTDEPLRMDQFVIEVRDFSFKDYLKKNLLEMSNIGNL